MVRANATEGITKWGQCADVGVHAYRRAVHDEGRPANPFCTDLFVRDGVCVLGVSADPVDGQSNVAQHVTNGGRSATCAQDEGAVVMAFQKGRNRPLESEGVGVVSDAAFSGKGDGVDRADGFSFW